MKTRMKLAFGVMFAAAAVMVARESMYLGPGMQAETQEEPCYSEKEVQLLMKSNHWTEEEVRTILDLACQFSHRSSKTTGKK